MKKTWGLLLLAGFFLASFSLKADGFLLNVNDVSGLDSPWPMVASIPFAKGELKDPLAIRIMNGNREIPSQVDVTATWRDGSIRWVLAGFTASPQGKYSVEYGEGVKKAAYSNPLKITHQADGGFTIDTGAAVYQFDSDKLLPENGWLVSDNRRIQILQGSGAGVYLLDNSGRTASVAGEAASIENTFLKEGPGRVVLKRSGWYVTETGEKLAKADVWLYFSAGTPCVRITHSLLFTEDTNKVWFKDYGLEFKTLGKPADVYCAVGENGEESKKVRNENEEIFMLQSDYPHFAERDYKAVIGSLSKGQDKVIEELQTAGDWAHGDYGSFGITLVMPWLAERYPKELSFGERGARAVLWSGRSGKELDFRARTLVEEYFQTWVSKGLGMLKTEEFEKVKSNAQGTARTHDIWFLPQAGKYNADAVKKTAIAGARQVLSLADPVRLCETEAIGYLMLHKDSERFPREEALISEYWDRFIVPLLAFPMNGYIAWGCYPDRSYGEAGGKTMSSFHALSNLREYGVRREPWRHYARSGERRYYDYGHRFSRFTGDWCLAHCDVPGSPAKQKGGFITSPGGSGVSGMLPLFWGDRTDKWDINAGDIGHWLLDYYLTGDEHSLDLLYMIKEAFKKGGWRPKGAPNQFHATGIRTLLTLFIMDWDEDSGKTIKEIVNEMVDLKSQNGFRLFESAYGSMYKDERTSHNVLEYYMETGDELAKEAFLKLLNQLYRFDRRGTTVSYKNYDGFTNSIAYWMTGDERYRTVVEQSVRDALYYSELLPLSADLAMKPKNPLDWPNLYVPGEFPGPRRTFFMGHHEYHNPFIGLPTALKLLAEKGWSGKTTPLVVKPMKVIPGEVIFYHERGSETQLNTYVRTGLKMNPETLRIFPYPQSTATLPVEGIKAAVEKRMSRGPWFDANPDAYPDPHEHYNIIITIPAETDTGLYLLSFGENETFTVLDSTSGKVALYCPEGFWSVSIGDHSGSGPYGRSGEGIPAYFRVPDGLKELEIFLGRSARVIAPDGSAVVEFSNKNIGNIKIPVEGKNGIWKIQFYIDSFHGTCPPVFIKMLNIEPIVAFGSPSLLPEGTTGKPVKIPQVQLPAPSASLEFVPGVSGKAVRLSNGQTLAFSEGAALDTGGHTFFPGMKGTAEFWFRADRCTHETPMEMTQYKIQSFLKAPHLNFRHFCEVRSSSRTFDSNLRFELLLSKPAYPPPGFHGQHFFKAGEWTHIAYTWEVKKGKKMEGELNIFVNGHKLLPAQGYSQVRKLAGSAEFELSGEGENIEIGPFDGSMDMLRISDTVKYTEDFVPLKSYGLDDDTRAVFYFDGNLKGISALSKEPVEAK